MAVLRAPSPGGLGEQDVLQATGMEVVADLPDIRGLARASELSGLDAGNGRLGRTADCLLDLAGVS